jgi:hypothetical protein
MLLAVAVAACLAAVQASPALSLNIYTADGKFDISFDGRAWLKGGEYQVRSSCRHM